MPRIEIDDDVYGYLQTRAIAFVEKPNDTLRRLLGISASTDRVTESASISLVEGRDRNERKKPKANLGALVARGVVTIGQKLYLHDHQGRRVPGAEAYVGGHGIFSGPDRKRLCSMSDLAQELLKKEGYQSDSVRGPSHWYTEEGRSITELWGEYLNEKIPSRAS